MGVFQLPDSVEGDAAGCLVYSFFCLFVNALLLWLIWTHHERTSYVAYISYFTLLATASSIVQQIYDYALWEDIMTAQFYYGKQHANDAEAQYQRGIMGLKLALSYIRIFCFIVESSLVLFFSFSLAATVYGWWAKKPQALRKLSITGRVVPIAFALLSVILLQLELVHRSFTLYFIIANAQLIISLAVSCVFLLMILGKYVQTRRQLKTWQSIQYGKLGSTTNSGSRNALNRRSRGCSTAGKASAVFDKWLVVRLSIAFMALCVFEWTNTAPRIASKGHIVESVNETEPDLSEKRAMSTVRGYLSGVSPSLLGFIVFGTTKTFQRKMYQTFVPSAIRKRLEARRHRNEFDEDNFGCKSADRRAPFASSTTGSSLTRASTLVVTAPPLPAHATKSISSTTSTPSTPTTPRTPYARRNSIRQPEHTSYHLVPIQESFPQVSSPTDHDTDAGASDEDVDLEAQTELRASQIGIAVGSPGQEHYDHFSSQHYEHHHHHLHHQAPQQDQHQQQHYSYQKIALPKPAHKRRATFNSLAATFYREDSSENLQQIPLSRFNPTKKQQQQQHTKSQGEASAMPSTGIAAIARQSPGSAHSFDSSTTSTTIWSESARHVSGYHHHHYHSRHVNDVDDDSESQYYRGGLGRTRFRSVSG